MSHMHRVIGTAVTLLSLILVGHSEALAVPLLQLDVAGGHYDGSTQTIVASSNPFTLYALATPSGNVTNQSILNQTFYISAAVSPQVDADADLGFFTVNGTRVDVTADMLYGKPPAELFEELQGGDPGDLAGHGIYPTYFYELAFQFSPSLTTATYDAAVAAMSPGGSPGPSGC